MEPLQAKLKEHFGQVHGHKHDHLSFIEVIIDGLVPIDAFLPETVLNNGIRPEHTDPLVRILLALKHEYRDKENKEDRWCFAFTPCRSTDTLGKSQTTVCLYYSNVAEEDPNVCDYKLRVFADQACERINSYLLDLYQNQLQLLVESMSNPTPIPNSAN